MRLSRVPILVTIISAVLISLWTLNEFSKSKEEVRHGFYRHILNNSLREKSAIDVQDAIYSISGNTSNSVYLSTSDPSRIIEVLYRPGQFQSIYDQG